MSDLRDTPGFKPTPKRAPRAWMADAACAGMDPGLFFPPKGGRPEVVCKPALDTCHTCPVLAECRSYARSTPIERGIWGGQTEVERTRPSRRKRP